MLEDADVWTSRTTESYVGISCHSITKDWQMETLNLATMPLEEMHTADNIVTWMEEVAHKFNILPKIKALFHNNRCNIVAAMHLLERKHGSASVHCAGHALQLIVNSALRDTNISRTLGASKSIVEYFHISEQKLKAKQHQMNTKDHKLIRDVSTRWNSTYDMIQRLLEPGPVTATLSGSEIPLLL